MPRPANPIDTSTYAGRLGQAIRRRREQRGLTVEALAAAIGVSAAAIYKIESGVNEPSHARIAALAAALDLPPAKLLLA